MQKLKNTKQNHTSHIAPHTSQKGITLIALIITIIVMLILVGVTINVALNGGLFEKGEKAAFQTEASTVKEELEIAKALKLMNAEGKSVEDYSDITLDLTNLDAKTKSKYASKIVVNKNGDVCYNPANVTDQEKVWLEEIGINAYVNITEGGNDEPDGDNPEGSMQEIEYFGISYTEEDGRELETVIGIDYTEKVFKYYHGEVGQKLQLLVIFEIDIINNYDETFYVVENGERIDIGTGATKIVREESPETNDFIKNGKLYMDVTEENEVDSTPLIPNFDISRLVEE